MLGCASTEQHGKADPSLDSVFAAMRSADFKQWEDAKSQLFRRGESVIPAIEHELYHSQDENESHGRLLMLLATFKKSAAPVLRRALHESSLQPMSISTFARHSDTWGWRQADVEFIISLLHDSDPDVQEVALDALHSVGPALKPAIGTLVRLLRGFSIRWNSGSYGRATANMICLAHAGPIAEEAVPVLIRKLDEANGDQGRYTVTWTLCKIMPDARTVMNLLIEKIEDEDEKALLRRVLTKEK